MKTIDQTYTINAPVEKVWASLIDPEEINQWGGGPAKMDDNVGTAFTLWDGDIHGTNQEVIPYKKLVQEWFGGEWNDPSVVTFSLHKKDGKTEVALHQENVPDKDLDSIAEGWHDYYLGAIKNYLEK